MTNEFNRADSLCRIMTGIVGIKNLRANTREAPLPMLRAMIYLQMANEGYAYSGIGRAFGRDHATVITMSRKWESIAKERRRDWREYLSIWDAFQDAVKNEPKDDRDDDRMTVAYMRVCLSNIPASASVVVEKGRRSELKYDQQLNTLFIRG